MSARGRPDGPCGAEPMPLHPMTGGDDGAPADRSAPGPPPTPGPAAGDGARGLGVIARALRAGNSIQGRLALVSLSVLALTSLLGLFAVHLATNALVESYGQKTRTITSVVLREMDALISARIGELTLMANHPDLAEALTNGFHPPGEILPQLRAVPVPVDPGGRPYPNLAFQMAEHLLELEQRAFGQPVYGDVVIANGAGVVIATTNPTAMPVLGEPAFLAEALARGHSFSTTVKRSSMGVRGWPLAVRLTDRRGRVIGGISTVVSSQWVAREAAARARTDASVEVRLTDAAGRLIYSSRPFRFLESIADGPVFAIADTPRRYGIVREGGRDRLYAVGSLIPGSVLGDLGWKLFIGEEAEIVLAPVDQLRQTLLILVLALAVLVTTIVALAGHRLTRPVLALRDAAEQLKAGDLGARAKVDSRTEIGDLAASFNAMVDRLAASQTRLEDEIAVRTKAQRALREQADFVNNVLDSLTQSAAVIDPSGRIVAVNRTWSAFSAANGVTGADPTVTVGAIYFRPWDDRSGTADGAGEAYEGIRQVQSGALPRFELEYPCDSPTEKRWYLMVVVPLNNRPGHVLITHNDISEIKHAQVDLEAKNARLGEEIRLRKTYETALTAERDRSETANQAKSEFLANMSHELRTPLNAIIGFSEVIREQVFGGVGNRRYLDYAGNIHDSGTHLLSLIDDLLDLSKIEAGKMELDETVVDLAALTTEVASMMADRVEHAGLLLDRTATEDLTVWVDRRKIKQVLLNLVSNAIKFSPRGSTVTLSVSTTADGNPQISVQDRGIGMNRDDLERALSLFGQAKEGRAIGGTGLGLPLARQLVELHEGHLSIDSVAGQGTTATVILPVHRRRPQADGVVTRRLSA